MGIILIGWGIALVAFGLGMLSVIIQDGKHAAAAAAAKAKGSAARQAKAAAARLLIENSTTGYVRVVCKNSEMMG